MSERVVVPAGTVLIGVAAIGVWWWFSTWNFVVPDPASTVAATVRALGDTEYMTHVRATALASLIAFLLSVIGGVLIGLVLGLVEPIRRWAEPVVVALNGIPKIVLFPVLVLFLGIGLSSKVLMGAIIGVFPVMINVAAGLAAVPPVYLRLGRSLQASRWQTFTKIMLPAVRRPFMTGVRLAVSLSVIGVVLAEMFATEFGIGRLILARYGSGQYEEMMSSVVLLLVFSFVSTVLLWRIEKRVR